MDCYSQILPPPLACAAAPVAVQRWLIVVTLGVAAMAEWATLAAEAPMGEWEHRAVMVTVVLKEVPVTFVGRNGRAHNWRTIGARCMPALSRQASSAMSVRRSGGPLPRAGNTVQARPRR